MPVILASGGNPLSTLGGSCGCVMVLIAILAVAAVVRSRRNRRR